MKNKILIGFILVFGVVFMPTASAQSVFDTSTKRQVYKPKAAPLRINRNQVNLEQVDRIRSRSTPKYTTSSFRRNYDERAQRTIYGLQRREKNAPLSAVQKRTKFTRARQNHRRQANIGREPLTSRKADESRGRNIKGYSINSFRKRVGRRDPGLSKGVGASKRRTTLRQGTASSFKQIRRRAHKGSRIAPEDFNTRKFKRVRR